MGLYQFLGVHSIPCLLRSPLVSSVSKGRGTTQAKPWTRRLTQEATIYIVNQRDGGFAS